jgi:hypothetical protein
VPWAILHTQQYQYIQQYSDSVNLRSHRHSFFHYAHGVHFSISGSFDPLQLCYTLLVNIYTNADTGGPEMVSLIASLLTLCRPHFMVKFTHNLIQPDLQHISFLSFCHPIHLYCFSLKRSGAQSCCDSVTSMHHNRKTIVMEEYEVLMTCASRTVVTGGNRDGQGLGHHVKERNMASEPA